MNTTEQVFLFGQVEDGSSFSGKQVESNEVDHEHPGLAAPTLASVQDLSCVCRICATPNDYLIPIYEGEGLQNNIADKINKHLPITVTDTDSLPRQLCYQCASTVLAWVELVECCTLSDIALRNKQDSLLENMAQTNESNKTDKEDIDNRATLPITSSALSHALQESLSRHIDVAHLEWQEMDTQSGAPHKTLFVCQKCEKYTAFRTIPDVIGHLEEIHYAEILDEESINTFATEHIVFVQIYDETELQLRTDSLATKTTVAPVIVPVRRRREKFLSLKSYYCPFCSHIFSSPKRLLTHLYIHSEVDLESGFSCIPCSASFKHMNLLISHLQKFHVSIKSELSQSICRSCGVCCSDENDLRKHVQKFHNVNKNRIYNSQPIAISPDVIADSEKVNDNEDYNHKSKMNAKYIPAECSHCHKVFSNKYNLKNHFKLHANKLPTYKCDTCMKTYRSRGALKYHMQTVHLGVLPFICVECGETFPTKLCRDVHRRIHSGAKPFNCTSCDKSFRSKNSLITHKKIHLDIRNYPCTECSKRFRKSTHLNYHIKTHIKKTKSPEKSALCRPALRPLQPTLRSLKDSTSDRQKHFANLLLCSSRGPLDVNKIETPIVNGSSLITSIPEKNNLQLSPKSDTSINDFYYDEIPIEYEKRINIMTKDESEDDEDDKPLTTILKIKNEADMFNHFYKALVNFKKHYEKSHKSKRVIFLEDPDSNDTEVSDGDDSETNYAGDSGNKYDDLTVNYKRRDMFDEKTRNDLNKARKTVNGRVYYECPLCSRNLRSTYTYIFHMRIHSGEKPCVCHLCGKQFRVNAGLQRHIKETHHKIKMHSCTICSSTFVNKQNLMQHQRIHTGERPYVCSQCGKRFKQSGSLYIHSKIHTDNYPYECNTCDAKFRQKSGLKHHMYKHSGERPNVCTYCGKAYRIKHDLNNHMLIHTELRPYVCPLCGISFRQRRTLRNHCKKTHDCLPC